MTDEEQRSSTEGGQEPFILGIREGVAAGYQAVEYVLEGMSESVRRRAVSGWTQTTGKEAPRQTSDRPAAPLNVDELVGSFARLLGRAGEVAQEAAHYIGERDHAPTRPEAPALLVLRAIPGARATVDFRISNTGATALSGVTLVATDLIGDEAPIPADAVNFNPGHIESIRPGGMTPAEIVVAVPLTTRPGTFRGLLHAGPGDAWTVLELTVEPRKVTAPARAVPEEGREPDEGREQVSA